MAVGRELVEKAIDAIDNAREKQKLDRLYTAYKLYKDIPQSTITWDDVDESINKINLQLREFLLRSSNPNRKEELLNRFASAKSLYGICKKNKGNSYKDSLLYDLTDMENELSLRPTFPSYLERLLEDKIRVPRGDK